MKGLVGISTMYLRTSFVDTTEDLLASFQSASCMFTDIPPDVLEVLMTEFKAALVRKGFRRFDIDDMYDRAKQCLETERRQPTGK